MTTTEIDRTPATERERLLDEATLKGLDLTAARGRVEALARGRRRTVRRSLGALAASALVLVGGVVLLGGEDPEEVVADRTDPTTTTTSASTTTTTLPAAPTTSAPVVTTTAAPTTVAPTTTTVTTTTVPPNQSMVARVRVLDPQVQAGHVAAVEIDWVDPDHAGSAPEVVADWGDPLVAAVDQPAPASRCDAPGASGGGVVRREFRYASPGVHTVRFTLSTCGAEGAYSERIGVEATVTVTGAVIDGAPAPTLVAVSPRTSSGLPVLPALDAATAVVVPADPAAPEVPIESRTPLLGQFATSGPATVLRVPAGTVGTLRLTWPDSPCTSTAELDLTTTTDDVALVALESSC